MIKTFNQRIAVASSRRPAVSRGAWTPAPDFNRNSACRWPTNQASLCALGSGSPA